MQFKIVLKIKLAISCGSILCCSKVSEIQEFPMHFSVLFFSFFRQKTALSGQIVGSRQENKLHPVYRHQIRDQKKLQI